MSIAFKKLTKASSPTATINNVSVYKLSDQVAPSVQYFKIERNDNFELQLTHYYDGSVEYSLDNGLTWTTCSAPSGQTDIIQTTNKNVMLRGTQNTTFYDNNNTYSNSFYLSPQNSPTTIVSGDLETLLDYQTVGLGGHPTMGDYAFARMFRTIYVTDAGQLILPSSYTTGCFSNMFNGNSRLIVAPQTLPNAPLASSCCQGMFYGCSNLITPPLLPASQLISTSVMQCYQDMFRGCTALNTLPKIYLMYYKNYCCRRMFQDCSNIKLSTTLIHQYTTEYRIPATGTATTTGTNWNTDMFKNTGGTFTSNPSANTVYYTSNAVV